jgi:hypothetical protein
MKGETLRERTRWCGIPTAPASPPEASAAALSRVPATPVLHSHPHDPAPGGFAIALARGFPADTGAAAAISDPADPPRGRRWLYVPIVLAAMVVTLLAVAVLLAAYLRFHPPTTVTNPAVPSSSTASPTLLGHDLTAAPMAPHADAKPLPHPTDIRR